MAVSSMVETPLHAPVSLAVITLEYHLRLCFCPWVRKRTAVSQMPVDRTGRWQQTRTFQPISLVGHRIAPHFPMTGPTVLCKDTFVGAFLELDSVQSGKQRSKGLSNPHQQQCLPTVTWHEY